MQQNFKDLEFLDFGSGFKVPYKKDDIETDIEELGKKLTKRFKAFVLSMKRFNSNLRTWKISEAGVFSKSKRGKTNYFNRFLQDSGFNHLTDQCFMGSQHHIENISNPKGKERFTLLLATSVKRTLC
jgi:diaminopimelate decarboxylase